MQFISIDYLKKTNTPQLTLQITPQVAIVFLLMLELSSHFQNDAFWRYRTLPLLKIKNNKP